MSKASNQIDAEIAQLRHDIRGKETSIARRELAGEPSSLAFRRGLILLRDIERRLVAIREEIRAADEAAKLQKAYAE